LDNLNKNYKFKAIKIFFYKNSKADQNQQFLLRPHHLN